MNPRRFVRWSFVIIMAIGQPLASRADERPLADRPVPDRSALEKDLADKLSGSTLTGHFTMASPSDQDKAQSGQDLKEEKYELLKVAKLRNDYWLFKTRIQYANHDLTVPLTLQVKWAGDTPVITVDDLVIPGLGTFGARVMIYGDQYAGTWSAKDHGGHLFGAIVKTPEVKAPEGSNL